MDWPWSCNRAQNQNQRSNFGQLSHRTSSSVQERDLKWQARPEPAWWVYQDWIRKADSNHRCFARQPLSFTMPKPFRTGDGRQGDLRTCCGFLKPRHFAPGTTPPLPRPLKIISSSYHQFKSLDNQHRIRQRSRLAFPHRTISNGFLVDHNEMAFYRVFILHSHYLSSYSPFRENTQFPNIKNVHVQARVYLHPLFLFRRINETLSQPGRWILSRFVCLLWWGRLFKAFNISTFKWILCCRKTQKMGATQNRISVNGWIREKL